MPNASKNKPEQYGNNLAAWIYAAHTLHLVQQSVVANQGVNALP